MINPLPVKNLLHARDLTCKGMPGELVVEDAAGDELRVASFGSQVIIVPSSIWVTEFESESERPIGLLWVVQFIDNLSLAARETYLPSDWCCWSR
jgi:hypothetical protein